MNFFSFLLLVIVIYLIVCAIHSGIAIGHFSRQPLHENDIPYGKKRYKELEANKVDVSNFLTADDINGKMYFFPCTNSPEKHKFAIICTGGCFVENNLDGEGFPVAAKLNELGYTAFVLEYHIGTQTKKYVSLDDLAIAISTIINNADKFNIIPKDYAVFGFSAGGNIAGTFGTNKLGYRKYNLPKPGVIVLGYPLINVNEWYKTPSWNIIQDFFLYTITLRANKCILAGNKDLSSTEKDYLNIQNNITYDYPSVYIWTGSHDEIIPPRFNSELLVNELQERKVDYKYSCFQKVYHGAGLAKDTTANEWLEEAVLFWRDTLLARTQVINTPKKDLEEDTMEEPKQIKKEEKQTKETVTEKKKKDNIEK